MACVLGCFLTLCLSVASCVMLAMSGAHSRILFMRSSSSFASLSARSFSSICSKISSYFVASAPTQRSATLPMLQVTEIKLGVDLGLML